MKTDIILTGIIKDGDYLLAVKRSDDDDFYPGAWEFPGGHLEDGESIKQGLARELEEEIGFKFEFNPIITNYNDEIKNKNGKKIHNIEMDFIINVNKNKLNVILSNEHAEYKWVTKDSDLLDEYIKAKLSNLKD